VTGIVPTAEFASLVHGPGGVADDDPAEAFHEASRLYPHVAPGRLATLLTLVRSPDLQQTVARSSRTHPHRPGVELPRGTLPPTSLRSALGRRSSQPPPLRRSVGLRELGTLLDTAYAASAGRRPVPSGGALYPLELYVLALVIAGTDPTVFHYDPFRHRLERIGGLTVDAVGSALVDPVLAERAAALLVLTGMFWRSRFKYGLRGYRFTLLEAGHVAQNVVLAAAVLGLSAVPVGGFYDRRVDALVGADGLAEASLYALVVGGAP
jgi:SagB-type dehydrogenase family enzyme